MSASIETTLLHAILANPLDDSPRLIYSDYLDENGQSERSEFIGIQCQIAATEHYPGERFCGKANGLLRTGVQDCFDCLPCILRRREKELLYQAPRWIGFGQIWDMDFAGLNADGSVRFGQASFGKHQWTANGVFRRGFVFKLVISWEDWSKYAGNVYPREEGMTGGHELVKGSILSLQPIEEVVLTTWPNRNDYWRIMQGPNVWTGSRWPGIAFTWPGQTCLHGLARRGENHHQKLSGDFELLPD